MRHHDIILPDLGLGDQTIVAGLWLVAEGRRVSAGEPVLEIVAGSAVVDLPSPADGVLVEVFVDEDVPLQPGQRLGVIESDAGGERVGRK